jgi:hypothetical protein
MRRTKAILVIFALLAAPLALVARAANADAAECGRICCLPHGHHVAQPAQMECHHSDRGNCPECAMKSGQQHLHYGFLAPIAPAAPLAKASVAIPGSNTHISTMFREFPAAGFQSVPFQPPRI